jgi:HAMP domain-containing protein
MEHSPIACTSRRRKIVRRLAFTSIALVVVGVVSLMAAARWAIQKTREVPDFYLQAEARMPSDLIGASNQLEFEVQELTDSVSQLGSWRAVFSEEQINAWLVHQLPLEFSKVLPAGVCDPRVVIENGKVLAAARYKHSQIDTVVSFELCLQLTHEPNVLAVEIRNLRAGALPLPLNRFLNQITRRAARDSLVVSWDNNDQGQPIGLLTVPSEHPKYVCAPVIVESIELAAGHVWLSGHTGPAAVDSFQPQGRVYRLASLRTRAHAEEPNDHRSFSSRL